MDKRFFLKSFSCFISIPVVTSFFFQKFYKNTKYKIFIKNFFSMGTIGKICIISKEDVFDLLNNAISKILQLEGKLTKFSIYSDIGGLNFFRSNILVADETLKILKLSVLMQSKTANYFNVALNPSIFELVNCNIQFASKGNILFFNDNFVSLSEKDYNVDLGGIGKGYIIQNVMNYLITFGVKHSFIEIGGDVKVFGGLPDGKPWEVLLDSYVGSSKLIKLYNGSISTSGKFTKRYLTSLTNKKFFHIVDPTTSSCNNYYTRITVIGNDLSICDSLSTACFNVPPQYFKEFINSFFNYSFDVS